MVVSNQSDYFHTVADMFREFASMTSVYYSILAAPLGDRYGWSGKSDCDFRISESSRNKLIKGWDFVKVEPANASEPINQGRKLRDF
jgi:hypothetical protein